ncbi:MAG: DUF4236 domain-containing protein [Phycisphaerae bacterium]
MGFRFFRRMSVGPGVRLNLSKSGVSPSFGVRGARITFGRQGVRRTVGIPGTGLFYTELSSSGRSRSRSSAALPEPRERLELSFFQRLVTPKGERAFVDGCRDYVKGNTAGAIERLRESTYLADAAFLAGFLALKLKRFGEAETYLKQAASRSGSLGRLFAKYGFAAQLALPITEQVTAHVAPSRRGALLGLVEVYQIQNRLEEAVACLKELRKQDPDDVVVNLSLAELVHEAAPNDKRLAKQIVQLAGRVNNDSSVHAALMLYKAKALRTLGLGTAAREVLTAALRKKKDRDVELLRAIRYERGCIYEELGQTARARRDFEKLFSERPDYEDVARRLGCGPAVERKNPPDEPLLQAPAAFRSKETH